MCLGGRLGLAAVGSGADGLAGLVDPEEVERVGVAELVGAQLQQGFAAGFAPEVFAAFEALVDLFDRGLDGAGRDRQARLAIGGIVGSSGRSTCRPRFGAGRFRRLGAGADPVRRRGPRLRRSLSPLHVAGNSSRSLRG